MDSEEIKILPAAKSLIHALGVSPEEFPKPFIGIVNSQTDMVPGHIHLERLSRHVRKGIKTAGGIPLEFHTIAICDGIAMGHEGMKYSLPSRDFIADSIEQVIMGHGIFKGLVFIGSCDKIVPGMLMAAARLNLPSIVVTGGPMRPGQLDGRYIDVKDAFAARIRLEKGDITPLDYDKIISNACPGAGSCAGLFTANSMACITEALGLSFPGCATMHALDPAKEELAFESGVQIMELVRCQLKARDIMTEQAFENAFRLDMAIGASTNTLLHLPAIAAEARYHFNLERINEISQTTPNLVRLSPNGPYHMCDMDRAGGVSAVLKELQNLNLLYDSLTVTGPIFERLDKAKNCDYDVIHRSSSPFSVTGGISILTGSLAPKGAVIKTSGLSPEFPNVFEAPVKIFNGEEEAINHIHGFNIKQRQILVIRYEGMAGGPGMREMLYPTSAITSMDMDLEIALITDGRFSGATKGPCIGHVSPEAALGGPIALVQDGDVIRIDLLQNRLDLLVSNEELESRRVKWQPILQPVSSKFLQRYRERVLQGAQQNQHSSPAFLTPSANGLTNILSPDNTPQNNLDPTTGDSTAQTKK